jgi:hypothetical protein
MSPRVIVNRVRKIMVNATKSVAVKVHANADAIRLASAVVLGAAVALIAVKLWGWMLPKRFCWPALPLCWRANAALFPKETEVIGHLEPAQESTHG